MNKIFNIDCLEGIKKIADASVSLVIADPPYFLGMTHNGQKGSFVDLAICKPFFEILFKEIKRVLKDDGICFFFTDWRGYAFYYPVFDVYFGASNLIVWDKINGPGNKLSFNHELIIAHFPKNFNKGGSNVWTIKGFSSGASSTNGAKVHPTQKPTEIIEKMVLEFSNEQDLIIDPFLGSGTSALVSLKNNRNFIGFELDAKNFDIAKKRLQDFDIEYS